MAAPIGNQFWKLRSKHGRDKLFASPELMWEAACEYFEWCEDNPLQEGKVFQFQGEIVNASINKMRAFTLEGLSSYLDTSASYFREFKSGILTGETSHSKDFLTVIKKIEETIYNQKFTGAAADMLNANIIARDLGLADKKEHSGEVKLPVIQITKPE